MEIANMEIDEKEEQLTKEEEQLTKDAEKLASGILNNTVSMFRSKLRSFKKKKPKAPPLNSVPETLGSEFESGYEAKELPFGDVSKVTKTKAAVDIAWGRGGCRKFGSFKKKPEKSEPYEKRKSGSFKRLLSRNRDKLKEQK